MNTQSPHNQREPSTVWNRCAAWACLMGIAFMLQTPVAAQTVAQTERAARPAEVAPDPAGARSAARRNTTSPLQKALGTRNFTYKAESKRIAEVLQDFAASRGVPAVVADGVEGVVNASFDVKPEVFLETIARAYNLLWYFDGTALYFYPGRAMQSRMIRLRGFSRGQVTRLLQSLELGDQRYPIRWDEAQSTLFVVGPPRHVELVTSAVQALDAGVTLGAERATRVVPLRFAAAGDRTVGGVVLPGLVQTLLRIYGSDPGLADATPLAGEHLNKDVPADTRGLKARPGQYVPTPRRNAAVPRERIEPLSGSKDEAAMDPRETSSPVFVADEAMNAVIVHARADKIGEYLALIEQLDQQPRLVELQATIIEVASDSVQALGIDWSVQGSSGSASVQGPANSLPGGGFNLSTLVADAGRSLLARVNALQQEGKARVVAKPSVLGVVNRTAVMREKRVANVRVAGQYQANLFSVEAGTLIEMTPQLVGGASPRVKLSLYIEDGNFELTRVDEIPLVKKTEIRTEAHVRDGHSLLIGGITVESSNDVASGVPGLRSVPVLGVLFRSNDKRAARMERMFLITPRLVDDTESAVSPSDPAAAALVPARAPRAAEVPSPAFAVPGEPVGMTQ